uniref:Uncharacterized protein n=1 Tax=Nelumbo nucifera TaxID=4432 RepID=A0A822ZB41_NELNU|nr:TPA_asm: hypothetical protein HUJ06_016073 [Nelumbo nucifera]
MAGYRTTNRSNTDTSAEEQKYKLLCETEKIQLLGLSGILWRWVFALRSSDSLQFSFFSHGFHLVNIQQIKIEKIYSHSTVPPLCDLTIIPESFMYKHYHICGETKKRRNPFSFKLSFSKDLVKREIRVLEGQFGGINSTKNNKTQTQKPSEMILLSQSHADCSSRQSNLFITCIIEESSTDEMESPHRENITWVLQREANRALLAGCPPPLKKKRKREREMDFLWWRWTECQ